MGTEEVKLHGTWASMFAAMVELALKLKGVPYDYVQEDLLNKSPALLSYNPVHKKVPVLVHRGKPLAESLVILHYVDETWPEPRLLPADPYERARVRFWIDFFHQKIIPPGRTAFLSEGEKREEAVEELRGHVRTLDEGLAGEFSDKVPFFHGETPGLLDIVIGPACHGLKAAADVAGAELLDDRVAPFLCSRVAALEELELAESVLPEHGKLVAVMRGMKEKLTALTPRLEEVLQVGQLGIEDGCADRDE